MMLFATFADQILFMVCHVLNLGEGKIQSDSLIREDQVVRKKVI